MTNHLIAVGTDAITVNQIVADAAPDDTVVFEGGAHIFENTITIRRNDINLIGQEDATITFRFDTDGNGRVEGDEGGNGFEVLGFGIGSNFVRKADRGEATDGIMAGANTLTATETTNLAVGDVIHISQENTPEYLAELGGCAPGTACYETALNRDFREFTSTITAIDPLTGAIMVAGAIPFTMDAQDTPINIVELTEIRSGVSLSNLNITFEILDPVTGQPIQPDPNLFENTQTGFTADDRPANAAIYVEGSTGLTLRDIEITNAPSDALTARNSILMDVQNLSVTGSFNMGSGGNGYGVNIYETFDSSFTGLDLFDIRHAVLFSAWNAETGNFVQINDTNRDVNFHGGPDSGNTVIVDRAELDYGTAPNAWQIVSNGGRLVHQQTDIYGLGNTVTFEEASGSSRDELIFANDLGATLSGNGGDDILVAGASADRLDGGVGNDWASYEASQTRVWVDLRGASENSRGADGDQLISIENLRGSEFNDLLLGADDANILNGSSGDDAIYARSGNDTVLGGDGADRLHGQRGDDDLSGGAGADQFYFDAAAGSDRILDFEDGSDLINFSRHDNVKGLSDLSISSGSEGAVVSFEGGSILLIGTNPSDLTADDFTFG